METVIYNQKGKETGKIELPNGIFGLPWNADLIHQVSVSMQANLRTNVAHVKDRSAVRGGGKKPWRQKGTGRARHGSSRSPLWVGGGVTHGPNKEKVFARTISKSMKTQALFTILSRKFKDNEILFVDEIMLKAPKTKEAKTILNAFAGIKGFEYITKKKTNALCIMLAKKDALAERSFRNLGMVDLGETRNLNVLDVLNAKCLVIVNPEESLKIIKAKHK